MQQLNIKRNEKNNSRIIQNFIKSTIRNSPTADSGARNLHPIGSAFLYLETSSNNHSHERVFFIWERADITQISNFTLYYNRYSILTNESKKSMGSFRIQLLLEHNSWSSR